MFGNDLQDIVSEIEQEASRTEDNAQISSQHEELSFNEETDAEREAFVSRNAQTAWSSSPSVTMCRMALQSIIRLTSALTRVAVTTVKVSSKKNACTLVFDFICNIMVNFDL